MAGGTPTLRESLRLRPELLKRLGWYYLRVHAFELFAHPESVARRIAVALEVPMPEAAPAAGEIESGADTVQARGELEAGPSSVPHRPAGFEEFSDPAAAEHRADPESIDVSDSFEDDAGAVERHDPGEPRDRPSA